MKFLIVEDDFISAKMIKKILSQYGDVDVASSGEIGLKKFNEAFDSKEPYDLICLDIMMANIDGFEVLNTIREKEDELDIEDPIKIIMTTALDDFESIKRAYAEQCEDYLIKPLNEQKLVDSMKKLGVIE